MRAGKKRLRTISLFVRRTEDAVFWDSTVVSVICCGNVFLEILPNNGMRDVVYQTFSMKGTRATQKGY
jgi:hypothetical protein